MNPVIVNNLVFTFNTGTNGEPYDKWDHFIYVWQNEPPTHKAVDIVAVEEKTDDNVTWIIEAKDFRVINSPPNKSNNAELPDTANQKVRDTLSGLTDASARATNPNERRFAAKALTSPVSRVVLHLEPYAGGPYSSLFPMNFPSIVLQKLKQLVQDIDPNPLVLRISKTAAAGVPWSVI